MLTKVMASEHEIIDSLFRRHGKPQFRSRYFHGYRAAPREQRMFLSMRILENEVCNGGLTQFLWNFFYHWREILEDCAYAYSVIGASAQASAIPQVTRILQEHEEACSEYIERASTTKNPAEFNAWYESAERTMDSPFDSLLCDTRTLAAKRTSWLSAQSGDANGSFESIVE